MVVAYRVFLSVNSWMDFDNPADALAYRAGRSGYPVYRVYDNGSLVRWL